MSQPRPLFIDTNGFVALVDEDDQHHEAAHSVREGIRLGDLEYGPLYTSRFVISETATTLLYGIGHREAVEFLETLRDSSTINILEVDSEIFKETESRFAKYDDQEISFIDHLDAVLSERFDISHIFAFEQDFATLGLIRVPVDTGEA